MGRRAGKRARRPLPAPEQDSRLGRSRCLTCRSKKKTALVTGALGFVGRHLVPKLEAAGYEVVATDIKNAWWQDCRYLEQPAAESLEWDVVVHLAANIVDVNERMKGGLGMYADLATDYAVCRHVQNNPPREAFICMSSCAVDYPDDPYAWVKLTLERLAVELHKSGIPVVILRPFSGYGHDQALSYPFPAILGRAMRREDPLTVWGGEQVRDWIHIEDLTDAVVYGIKHFPRGIPIDIGTGVGVPFTTLAETIAAEVGYKPVIFRDGTKAKSSALRVADTTLAAAQGFESRITLREGIRRALLACAENQIVQ